MTLLELYNLLLKVGIPVAHYETELTERPYIVYQELFTSYDWASGCTVTEKIKCEVVHVSKTEFDPTFEILKKILLEAKIGFSIETVFELDKKDILNNFDLTISRDREA
jgi:hypothetical protein